jgi:hypothetical protein
VQVAISTVYGIAHSLGNACCSSVPFLMWQAPMLTSTRIQMKKSHGTETVWKYQPSIPPKYPLPYYFMPMSTVHASPVCGQKRKRPPEIDPTADSSPPYEPPWKKAGFRSAEEANVAFWNNLSKVPLYPRALKEFDRWNSLAASSTYEPVAWMDPPDPQRSPTALKSCSTQLLKRFARRGGPDLHDLRGVLKAPDDLEILLTTPF